MNVLIIGQNQALCQSIISFVSNVDFQCAAYSNPIDGIASFFDKHFDVVLLVAPFVKMELEEILKRLQSANPFVKVIVLTEDNLLEKENIFLSRCAIECIQKPSNNEELRRLINRITDIGYEMAS